MISFQATSMRGTLGVCWRSREVRGADAGILIAAAAVAVAAVHVVDLVVAHGERVVGNSGVAGVLLDVHALAAVKVAMLDVELAHVGHVDG